MALIGPGGRPLGAGQQAAEPAAQSNPHIKEGSQATFAEDVLQTSLETPVIVDFWAPWCGPCKQLGPVLERTVNQAKGAVRLVKINVDENQELAQQLRIQSIPAVYAFRNGQPVDGFLGAMPESQVRAFVQHVAGGAAEAPPMDEGLDRAAQALAARDIGRAAQIYGQILQEDPGNPKAVAGLARCYLASGDLDRARQALGLVRPDGAGDEAIRAIEAELKLKETAKNGGDVAPLKAKVAEIPGDLQARYDLALALDVKGEREAALDQLLEIVRRDRNWNEQAARKQLVTLFEAMGPADPRTISARRRLSAILFA
ncbi:MAG: thioredoxin [Alphaproteobacteria bacterium]